MVQSICILSFSQIDRDARVLRQIKYLSPKYHLTVIGYGQPPKDFSNQEHIEWIPVSNPISNRTTKILGLFLLTLGKLIPSFYYSYFWRASTHRRDILERARLAQCDGYLANDWDTLPIAAEAAKTNNSRLVFDAHEYGPLQFEHDRLWKTFNAPMIRYLLHKYADLIDKSITVAPLIADRYRQEFNLDPITVMNVPAKEILRQKKVDPDNIRLIHHGGAIRHRQLETMIETLVLCNQRYSLHFMLVETDTGYLQELRNLAEDLVPDRVFFHSPVPPDKINQILQDNFDVGFCFIAPTTYGYLNCLPNKFFDYILAGLPVLIGPSPSMTNLVNQYRFGQIASTFTPLDLAATLNQIEFSEWKIMGDAAREAVKIINADNEMDKLLSIFKNILSKS